MLWCFSEKLEMNSGGGEELSFWVAGRVGKKGWDFVRQIMGLLTSPSC